MQEFSIKYEDKQIKELFAKLLTKTKDLTPAMQEIGEEGLIFTDLNFQLEQDPYGVPWQKLSPYTIRKKKSEGKILNILQRTGMMRSRVNYQATQDKSVISINDKKAYKHQFGVGVPKRQILGVGSIYRQRIVGILKRYLLQLDS